MTSFPSVLESVNDLSNQQIVNLFTLAENLEQDKVLLTQENSLKKPVIYTLFFEDSTRTKLSFAIAAKRIGAHYIDFPIQTSSMNKGENLEETLLTLKAQGADTVIIRSKETEVLHQFKNSPPLKLINGGDGINEHPTQALLDFYFINKTFKNKLHNFTVGIAGDIIHSRVAHSLIKLLLRFDIKVAIFGPKEFIPKDLHASLGKNILVYDNKVSFIKNINLLYLLRIQLERHQEQKSVQELQKTYLQDYGFSLTEIEKENPNLQVLHPGPVNIGLEIDQALLKSKHYLGLKQVEVSIYTRMAILLEQLNNNDEIINNAKKIKFSLL